MQSKNKPAPTAAERRHILAVKALNCSVCNAPGPSECHEIKQGAWWVSLSACADCHRGVSGIHGDKSALRMRHMDELDALNVTIGRLFGAEQPERVAKQFKPSKKMVPRPNV